jgi:hypothetical protein
MKQIGDLEGETLSAVRAACQRCHLPLPATCLAYSLFQAASKSDAKSLYATSFNEAATYMQVFKDREAEQMQTEICSKLEKYQGLNKELFHAGTSRFVALAELHATSSGQKSVARRLLRCKIPYPPAAYISVAGPNYSSADARTTVTSGESLTESLCDPGETALSDAAAAGCREGDHPAPHFADSTAEFVAAAARGTQRLAESSGARAVQAIPATGAGAGAAAVADAAAAAADGSKVMACDSQTSETSETFPTAGGAAAAAAASPVRERPCDTAADAAAAASVAAEAASGGGGGATLPSPPATAGSADPA